MSDDPGERADERLAALSKLTTREVMAVLSAHGVHVPDGTDVLEAVDRKIHASLRNARLMGRLNPDSKRTPVRQETRDLRVEVERAMEFDLADTQPGYRIR